MGKRISVILTTVMAFLAFGFHASAAPVQWTIADGGNDHWYEIIQDPQLPYMTWTQAKSAAESASYLGMQGHLATLTSQGENDFVGNTTFLGDSVGLYSDNVWIGGYQTSNDDEPAGNWAWVTGETWSWTNWYTNEPNGGDYLRLGADIFGSLGFWFDQVNTPSTAGSAVAVYIVEYEPSQTVPVPGAVWLLGTGLFGLFRIRGKGRGRG